MLGSVLSTWHILTHLTPTSIQRDRYYYHHTPYKETEVQSSVTCPLRNGSGIWTQTPESVLSTIILPPASFLFPFFLEFPIPRINFPPHCLLPHVDSSAPNLGFLFGLFFFLWPDEEPHFNFPPATAAFSPSSLGIISNSQTIFAFLSHITSGLVAGATIMAWPVQSKIILIDN